MPAEINEAEVRRIAALAHLALGEEDVRLLAHQLAAILAYVSQLDELHLGDEVPPTTQVTAGGPVERADDPRPSLPVEAALGNAPARAAGDSLFIVPRVIRG